MRSEIFVQAPLSLRPAIAASVSIHALGRRPRVGHIGEPQHRRGMLRHGDWNGAPARLGLLLEPIGRKAERRAVEKAACDRAIERVDDGRDIGLGEIEHAPFRIGREGGLHLRPCRMQTLVEIGSVARVVEIEPEALKQGKRPARDRGWARKYPFGQRAVCCRRRSGCPGRRATSVSPWTDTQCCICQEMAMAPFARTNQVSTASR